MAAQSPLTARLVLELRSETIDGEQQFSRASSVVMLRSGAIVVADDDDHMLRFFDARGRPFRSVGRSGGGPSEFASLDWVGECAPDSVFVADSRRRRISVFTAGGTFIRQFAAAVTVGAEITCSVDGKIAALVQLRPVAGSEGGTSNVGPTAVSLAVWNREGMTLLAVDSLRGPDVLRLGGGGAPLPNAGGPKIAIAKDEVVVMNSSDGQVLAITLTSGARRVTKLSIARRRSTARHTEAASAEFLEFVPPSVRPRIREALVEVSAPELLPMFHRLIGDSDGRLWLETSMPGDPETVLGRLSSAGRIEQVIRMPSQVRVWGIVGGLVYGVHVDQSGEQSVVVYSARPGS